jgi:hypothetical protein
MPLDAAMASAGEAAMTRESGSGIVLTIDELQLAWRAEWHVLGMLDAVATRRARQEPARLGGREMPDDAAGLLADASGG